MSIISAAARFFSTEISARWTALSAHTKVEINRKFRVLLSWVLTAFCEEIVKAAEKKAGERSGE